MYMMTDEASRRSNQSPQQNATSLCRHRGRRKNGPDPFDPLALRYLALKNYHVFSLLGDMRSAVSCVHAKGEPAL